MAKDLTRKVTQLFEPFVKKLVSGQYIIEIPLEGGEFDELVTKIYNVIKEGLNNG